jgi:hypothetical protein
VRPLIVQIVEMHNNTKREMRSTRKKEKAKATTMELQSRRRASIGSWEIFRDCVRTDAPCM